LLKPKFETLVSDQT